MLPVAGLSSRDTRAASLPRGATAGGAFDARHHRDHAFARGDAAAGWAQSTATGPGEQRRWLRALDARVAAGGERRARSLPRGRPTLAERQTASSGAQRASREATAAERRAWRERFGPDGGAAMEAAAAAERARGARGAGPRPRPRVRPTTGDLMRLRRCQISVCSQMTSDPSNGHCASAASEGVTPGTRVAAAAPVRILMWCGCRCPEPPVHHKHAAAIQRGV